MLTSCAPRRYCRAAAPLPALRSAAGPDPHHRWWSETDGPDIEEEDVYSLAAAAHIGIKLHSARYPDSIFQTLGRRPPLSLTF